MLISSSISLSLSHPFLFDFLWPSVFLHSGPHDRQSNKKKIIQINKKQILWLFVTQRFYILFIPLAMKNETSFVSLFSFAMNRNSERNLMM
jgi:hypothetical protein